MLVLFFNHRSAHRAHQFFGLWWISVFFICLSAALLLYITTARYQEKIPGLGLILLKGELKQVISPTTGTVLSWLKEEGDSIKKGEVLGFIADYDEPELTKPVVARNDGVIAEIIAYDDTQVNKGQPLVILTSHGNLQTDLELTGFVSSLDGKKIQPGMSVYVQPSIAHPYRHGELIATVKRVGKLPMTKAAIQSVLKIPEMASYIRNKIEGEPFIVTLTLNKNASGYEWTGSGLPLDSGVFADFKIIVDERSFLEKLWPSLLASD